jgi:glycosyltransferase involved in cell wall biosynthesis
MAAGKPIIVSRVGGIARLIEHEENGLLVDPGDSQQIRAALERLIESPELCRRLGAAARALVSQVSATAETADWLTAYSAAMSR